MEEDLKTKAASLKNHISGFTETYIQIAKVKATKGASNAAAAIAIGVSVFLLAIFFIIFAFTALAWWLADVFESPALGFLTVAGLFLFLIVLIILLSKKVIVPFIRNTIISKVYD
ncbi:MAG TPA: phage holin family protein, partial [Flavisolibacter sp.]|nr:phage holin family protein [Flavisolibacter sp.]